MLVDCSNVTVRKTSQRIVKMCIYNWGILINEIRNKNRRETSEGLEGSFEEGIGMYTKKCSWDSSIEEPLVFLRLKHRRATCEYVDNFYNNTLDFIWGFIESWTIFFSIITWTEWCLAPTKYIKWVVHFFYCFEYAKPSENTWQYFTKSG